MISPRVRRLKLDHELLMQRFANWPLIRITGSAGMPPEVYRFTYMLKGLYVANNGDILERTEHVMEVNLSLGYPRRPPHCRMLTPVFHPNFDTASVCIGDFWAASEGLDDLIVRVGRMISYQEFNTKSPLNGLAARWAAQHPELLPVDPREVAPPSMMPEKPQQESAGIQVVSPVSSAVAAPPPALVPAVPTAVTPVSAAVPQEPLVTPPDPWEVKIVISPTQYSE
jgi:ubiquitin-protein ligase